MAKIKAKNKKTGVEYEFSKEEFNDLEKNPLTAGKYVVDKVQEPKEVTEMKTKASKTAGSTSSPTTTTSEKTTTSGSTPVVDNTIVK